MNGLPLHPALCRLLRFQAAAGLARAARGFRGRRRLGLSLLALLLSVIWLGQALLSLLLRDPVDPERIRSWIPLSLTAYALWHVLKTACRKPIEPMEWTAAERELLGAAPLSRRELVVYRLMTIGPVALAKALCFSILMLPDLHLWTAGLFGMFLALMLVDLLRMALEIYAYGLARAEFIRFRVAVVTVAAAAAISGMASTVCAADWPSVAAAGPLGVLLRFMASITELRHTWIGQVVEAPFELYGRLILTSEFSPSYVLLLVVGATIVVGMMRVVIGMDDLFHRRRVLAERTRCRRAIETRREPRDGCRSGRRARVAVPRRLSGAGSLAWRQWLGAYGYRAPVLFSLILPAALCGMTILSPQPRQLMLMQLVGGLVFYSFVLLPTALKFDFRRDIDRLAAIKALPIGPVAVTLGQLTVPVLITTSFQVVMLTLAMTLRPYHPLTLVLSVLLLLPVNLLIFSLENLIFMLYPYRAGQEGLAVFLRTILTFTAKGIMFAVGTVVTLVWALASRSVATNLLGASSGEYGYALVFAIGMWMLIGGLAILTTILLIRVYRRFDPATDLPALA